MGFSRSLFTKILSSVYMHFNCKILYNQNTLFEVDKEAWRYTAMLGNEVGFQFTACKFWNEFNIWAENYRLIIFECSFEEIW